MHNQRSTNSCVAQAMVKALEYKRNMAGLHHKDLSTMALWYWCRQRMNPPRTDKNSGTYIWLAADTLRKVGVCEEQLWPFDPEKTTQHPGVDVLRQTTPHKIDSAVKIMSEGDQRCHDIIQSVANGHPVVYGAKVGNNWMRYDGRGVIGAPQEDLGWHATTIVGWHPSTFSFIGENSWGTGWGDKGYYKIHWSVITDDELVSDFWTITSGYESYADKVKSSGKK